jgi:hypothetical protein
MYFRIAPNIVSFKFYRHVSLFYVIYSTLLRLLGLNRIAELAMTVGATTVNFVH